MVHLCIRPSLISLIVVVFFSSFVVSSHANKVVEIGVICNHTDRDTGIIAFCLKLLNSTPPRPGADLATLAQYTTDILRSNVTTIISLVKLIAESGSNSAKKQYLDMCLSCYSGKHGALHEVEAIQQGLKSKGYSNMEKSMENILLSNKKCILKPESPKHPILLLEYGEILNLIGVVFQTILYYLENN